MAKPWVNQLDSIIGWKNSISYWRIKNVIVTIITMTTKAGNPALIIDTPVEIRVGDSSIHVGKTWFGGNFNQDIEFAIGVAKYVKKNGIRVKPRGRTKT